jgi:hypothetical protein
LQHRQGLLTPIVFTIKPDLMLGGILSWILDDSIDGIITGDIDYRRQK